MILSCDCEYELKNSSVKFLKVEAWKLKLESQQNRQTIPELDIKVLENRYAQWEMRNFFIR